MKMDNRRDSRTGSCIPIEYLTLGFTTTREYKMKSDDFRHLAGRRTIRGAVCLALVCCVTQLAEVAYAASDSPGSTALIRVPPQNLDGKEITTPFDMNEMKPFIDGQEGAMPTTFHKLIFKNQLLVDVVETSGVGVHFPN